MDAAGDAFVVGCYSLAKASTMTAVVKDILRNYQDNPGIREGDAFICNDPYVGAQHQNDTALVMPVFVDGNRIAWDRRRGSTSSTSVGRRRGRCRSTPRIFSAKRRWWRP